VFQRRRQTSPQIFRDPVNRLPARGNTQSNNRACGLGRRNGTAVMALFFWSIQKGRIHTPRASVTSIKTRRRVSSQPVYGVLAPRLGGWPDTSPIPAALPEVDTGVSIQSFYCHLSAITTVVWYLPPDSVQ
jgi:hypothetical protein